MVNHGGIIAYPTESVYGLGCDPLNPEAVLRLLALKQRAIEKGLIVIAANIEQIAAYIDVNDEQLLAAARSTWPGPITWLLTPRDEIPDWLTGGHALLAVRITQHPVAAALCRLTGPLVSTSANIHHRAPARTNLQVRRYFGRQLDTIVPGEVGGLRAPTEIRNGRTGETIRAGSPQTLPHGP